MRKLILILLALALLTGCAAESAPETTSIYTLPETTAAPETTLPPDPLDALLSGLTVEQKVGQLFMARPEQLLPEAGTITEATPALENALAKYPLGGIILFADNVVTPDQLLALNAGLSKLPGVPLFIAVDEEGGIVTRLARNETFGLPRYGSPRFVASSGDCDAVLEMGRTIGGYLHEYGFNLDFAPVADVNTNPRNPVIGNRAFSDHPEIAARMAAAFAQGLGENGIIATFKHFPGHGDTAEDSHSGLAVVYKTLEELESCEFLPFLEASERDMIMIAHVALPNVTGDMTPATLSRQIVTDILKDQLGFEGLIVTDAMEMGAIVQSYGSAEAAVAALEAGCDIILMPENLEDAFNAVLAALEEGRLTMQWLDETVYRILAFKQLHGIL